MVSPSRLAALSLLLVSLVACGAAESGGAPSPMAPPRPPRVERTTAFLKLDQEIVESRYVSPATIDDGRLLDAARRRMQFVQAENVDALLDACVESDRQTIDHERISLTTFLAEWRVRKFDVRAAKALPEGGRVEVWTVVLKESGTRLVRDALRSVWARGKDGWRVECGHPVDE